MYRKTKATAILLSLCMGVTAIAPAVAAPVSAQAATTKAATANASYMSVKFRDLYQKKKLKGIPKKITVSEEKEGDGLLLTGKKGDYAAGKISLDQKFTFSGNPVGRFTVDAIVGRGTHASIDFYLDKETTPFASIDLKRQRKKGKWTADGDKTVDMLEKKLSGKTAHTVSFAIRTEDSGKVSVLLRSIEFVESSLPVIWFDIDETDGMIAEMNADVDHQTECYGNVTVQIPDGYKSEYTDKKLSTKTYALDYVRGRGNSTWMTDKKPYKVKLDKKADLFGMGENKHWVLLANRYDNSFLRNKITYWLGDQLGMEFTPKSVPVDVVMNGVYYGSYYLSEQIRVGKSRVNIDDLSDDEKTQAIKSGPELTGGYLLSMSPGGDDGTKRAFKTSRENEYLIESPDFDGYQNEAQYNYIRNYMQDTEDALFGKNFKNSKGKSYTDYIDLDSAADYYWVQEFSMNGDAYLSGSTYLYKKRNGKLFWGPLWDFDYVAWGDLEYEERNTSGFVHNGTALMGQMLKDKKFSDKVKKRWPVFKQKINEIIKKGGQLDKYYNQLVISQRYDHEKWGTYGEFEEWMEGGNAAAKTDRTYSEEKEALRLWIKERLQWVDANLNELTPKQYKITYKAGKKVVATETHYNSEELTTFPKAPAKKGYVFDGWYITQFGETSRLTAGTILDQNLTATAKYIKADKAIKPKNIYFLQNEIWIGLYNEQYSLTYDIMPQNAIVENLTWKSSKPSVATVGQDGVLTLRAAGTTKITASVKGGVKGTVTVHVLSEKESEELSEGTVRLDKEEVSMQEGQYRKISPVYDPTPCYQQFFRFMSLDESIATVTENGVIVGNKAGTTWVLVMADYGDFVKCKVTVTAKTTKPPKTTFTKVKAKKKAVTLKWKKKSKKKIAGYQIQYSTSKKFTKKTTKKVNIKKTKTTKTIKKLKSKKKYYFRIRTWKKSGKKKVYSGWSKVKKAKVK